MGGGCYLIVSELYIPVFRIMPDSVAPLVRESCGAEPLEGL
jgi:hypothetical protein